MHRPIVIRVRKTNFETLHQLRDQFTHFHKGNVLACTNARATAELRLKKSSNVSAFALQRHGLGEGKTGRKKGIYRVQQVDIDSFW